MASTFRRQSVQAHMHLPLRRLCLHLLLLSCALPERPALADERAIQPSEAVVVPVMDFEGGSGKGEVRPASGSRRALTVAARQVDNQASEVLVALLVLAGGVPLLLGMRLRHRRKWARLRAEACAEERERIARELHDTLFQSNHGLILSVQGLSMRLSADDPARPLVERALELADRALNEGRERVQALRRAPVHLSVEASLGEALEDLCVGRVVEHGLQVGGGHRPMRSPVAHEVVSIAREAIANAVRHGKASRLGVQLTYGSCQLELRVADDGQGIPPSALAGRTEHGHWGLVGMRERAALIGGSLRIAAVAGGGTEVVLHVPARRAYSEPPPRAWWTVGRGGVAAGSKDLDRRANSGAVGRRASLRTSVLA